MSKKSPFTQLKNEMPKEPIKAYKRGYADGYSDAISATLNLTIWTLVDNNLLSDDGVDLFHERFTKTLDMMNTDHISMADIKKTLKKEYDWKVNVK